MAIVLFLFASALGVIGAMLQLALGAELITALNTYAFMSIGLPVATILAQKSRRAKN